MSPPLKRRRHADGKRNTTPTGSPNKLCLPSQTAGVVENQPQFQSQGTTGIAERAPIQQPSHTRSLRSRTLNRASGVRRMSAPSGKLPVSASGSVSDRGRAQLTVEENPVKRTRSSKPKSRTGCLTCRTRRIKCDEAKPSCRNCIKSGRNCDGYSGQPAAGGSSSSGGNLVPASGSPSRATSPATPDAYAIPFKIPGSQKDRRLFHYFCVTVSTHLSGYGYLGASFWSNLVLQCSQHESVVRQAVIALSSAHLDYMSNEGTDIATGEKVGTDTLLQYNKAIRQLRKYLASEDKPSAKVALVCCVLFCWLESLRGEINLAFEHLRNGVDILVENDLPVGPVSAGAKEEDLEELKYVFMRMELQAMQLANIKSDESRVPRLQLISTEERAGAVSCVPTSMFDNLDEAHRVLHILESWLFCFFAENHVYKYVPFEGLPQAILEEKQRLLIQYQMWDTALESFVSQRDEDMDDREPEVFEEGVMVLKLHHRIQQMLLRSVFPLQEEAVFDVSPNPDIDCILEWAERLCSSSTITPGSFSSETGIVAPLGILVLRCHDQAMRARAMIILATCRRRESFVDSQALVDAVEQDAQTRARKALSEQIADAAQRRTFRRS